MKQQFLAKIDRSTVRRRVMFAVAIGLAAVIASPTLAAQAAPAPTDSSIAARTSLDGPPKDDPAAVEEYLELLAEFRAANLGTRSAVAAAGPCLSAAAVGSVAEGAFVAVYRSTSAPYLVCVNAAQSVYDNEYKALVSSAYEGQKWRDQLVCHIANAWDKRPWNLDSWRPNVGYAATVAAGCNP